jgi:hypothetical protein
VVAVLFVPAEVYRQKTRNIQTQAAVMNICLCMKEVEGGSVSSCGKHYYHAKCSVKYSQDFFNYCPMCHHEVWNSNRMPALELTPEGRAFPIKSLSRRILSLDLMPSTTPSQFGSMVWNGIKRTDMHITFKDFEANAINAHQWTNINKGAYELFNIGLTDIHDLITLEFGRNHVLRRALYPPDVMAYWFGVRPEHLLAMGITMDDFESMQYTCHDIRHYGISAHLLLAFGLKRKHIDMFTKDDWYQILGLNQELMTILE